MENIKCALIGDDGIGKTSMLISYTNHTCRQDYIPTVYDFYSSVVDVDGWQIRLHLVDTAGQDQYKSLRRNSLPHSDIVLICFSVMDLQSFRNVELKWLPEVKQFCPLAKILLIGNKFDMRRCSDGKAAKGELEINNEKYVTHAEGLDMANKICAVKYFECSALTTAGLNEVFEAAARCVLMPIDPEENYIDD